MSTKTSSADVLTLISASPGQSREELAEALGMELPATCYHLTKLSKTGAAHSLKGKWRAGSGPEEGVDRSPPWIDPTSADSAAPETKRRYSKRTKDAPAVEEVQDDAAATMMPCVWADGSMTITRGEEQFYLPADDVISLSRFMTLSLPHFRMPSAESGITQDEQRQLQKLLPNLTDFLRHQGENA